MNIAKRISNLRKKTVMSSIFLSFSILLLLSFQNCAEQNMEFVQESMTLKYALVYDGTESDQSHLLRKAQGYSRPSLNEIFNNWSRVSGGHFYQKSSEIVQEPEYAPCFTQLNSEGNWLPFYNPDTKRNENPGSSGYCINSYSLAASSWSYLPRMQTLRNATNAGNFSGFISGVPFDRYQNEAILTSENKDDDIISLIVASVKDIEGNIHVLGASRSHGGAGPKLGWGFVYFKNGSQTKVFNDTSVGGVYKNDKDETINLDGWSGKKSAVRVIRNQEIITAYASDWFKTDSAPDYTAASKIELNLNDPSLEGQLDIFKGPQKYGYGSLSQLGSSFQSISFTSIVNEKLLYDLKNDSVYSLIADGSGRYEKLVNRSAFKSLGNYVQYINPETQKAFDILPGGRYQEVDGDKLNLNKQGRH